MQFHWLLITPIFIHLKHKESPTFSRDLLWQPVVSVCAVCFNMVTLHTEWFYHRAKKLPGQETCQTVSSWTQLMFSRRTFKWELRRSRGFETTGARAFITMAKSVPAYQHFTYSSGLLMRFSCLNVLKRSPPLTRSLPVPRRKSRTVRSKKS